MYCLFTDKQRRRSELNSLGGGVIGGDEEEWGEKGGGRRPQRRAATNLAKNVYSMDVNEEMEYVDSPASTSSAKDTPPAEVKPSARKKVTGKKGGVRGARRGEGGRGGEGRRGGREEEEKESGMKVPPMKIKLIGRTGASDSPIFFAESLGEVCSVIQCGRKIGFVCGSCVVRVFSLLGICMDSGPHAKCVHLPSCVRTCN